MYNERVDKLDIKYKLDKLTVQTKLGGKARRDLEIPNESDNEAKASLFHYLCLFCFFFF